MIIKKNIAKKNTREKKTILYIFIYQRTGGTISFFTNYFNKFTPFYEIIYVNRYNIKKIKFKKGSNCIFIKIIKDIFYDFIKKNKNNFNFIYIPTDFKWQDDPIEFRKYYNNISNHFDLIMCNSLFHSKILNLNSNIYYHPYDENFKCNIDEKKNIIYIGDLKKSSFDLKILEIYNIVHVQSSLNKNLYEEKIGKNIHIDCCLKNHIYYNIHTSTKLATAYYAKSIFICNKLPVYVELLGEDYEFYFYDDLSNLDKIIDKAKNILKDDKKYEKYLSILDKKLKIKFSYENYIELFCCNKKKIN
jgi:hypothetical protein